MFNGTMLKSIFLISSVCLYVLLSISSFANTESVCLKHFQIRPDSHDTQFVFEFDKSFHQHSLLLSNPDRLVIDFDGAVLKTSLIQPLSDSLVKKIRSNLHENRYLRIVFDLNQKMDYTLSVDNKSGKHQLILKLMSPSQLPVLTMKANNQKTNLKEVANKAEAFEKPLSLAEKNDAKNSDETEKTKPKRKIVIVIDPGHGGKDPGAVGKHGAREKSVVLNISHQLEQLLNHQPGFRAVLTREGDYYIGLRQRLAIARKDQADMFIAIHADAAFQQSPTATGVSVYALSERGATSEAARWLAEKENASELMGGLIAEKDKVLRSVLMDLSQTHTIEVSLQIGNSVLHELNRFTRLHYSNVEQAAFVVLKSPDIPSILVETGFITNPFEESKLTNFEYQRQVAYAIMQGIKHYFGVTSGVMLVRN